MCGIAGIFNSGSRKELDFQDKLSLGKMTNELYHRGPDGEGIHVDGHIGLGHRRLSIIDIEGGGQPIFNEDRSICVIFNGEIFNYIELRKQLKALGHQFKTMTDTEVIVHAYEEYGYEFPNVLNGQFSIALWDKNIEELILVRDRAGIHPLFYSILPNRDLVFASEIKSVLSHQHVDACIDPAGLEQIFTLWVNIPPRTVFKGISELPPGHLMIVSNGNTTLRKYWDLEFPDAGDFGNHQFEHYKERLEDLLIDSIRLRLRSDVPVAAYLSGGLDSSLICSMLKNIKGESFETFSISFQSGEFDESSFQKIASEYLGVNHSTTLISDADVTSLFSEVVRLAERPILRTAPAPMLKLSQLAGSKAYKVVLTGEGADEVLGGYNIFKEDKIRRFCASQPNSKIRPLLFERLYPYIGNLKSKKTAWQHFFSRGLQDLDNPFYSHMIRWNNTSFTKNFFSQEIKSQFNLKENVYNDVERLLPDNFMKWHPLCRAQYLEFKLFMPGNLLSSQGDRMLMGNSLEGRFPYLDHRLIEFAGKIPPKFKINGLNEKYILKQIGKDYLPNEITSRDKRPYRAPIQKSLGIENNLVAELLSSPMIRKYGYFDEVNTEKLLRKTRSESILSERENMALVGIASQQLIHHHFVEKRS